MATDFSTISLADAELRNRAGRPSQTNPAIEGGWVEASWNEGVAKSLVVEGRIVEVQAQNKQREPLFLTADRTITTDVTDTPYLVDKLTGEAAHVKRWLIKAAELAQLGVAIQTEPVGKTKIRVTFQARERRAYTRKSDTDE